MTAKGEAQGMRGRYVGRWSAPEFPPETPWIGSERPVRLSELRGRLVILDFWTFC